MLENNSTLPAQVQSRIQTHKKIRLFEENITTNKRKSANNIKIELEEEINKCFPRNSKGFRGDKKK